MIINGKKILKADFLTIPDAPNYEINGYFKVRNKKTGRILSNKKRVNKPNIVTTLWHNNKQVKRDVKTFYRQAVSAINDKFEWFPLASFLNKYEINGFGIVRNSCTKKELQIINNHNCQYYHLRFNGKTVHKRPEALLAEIFGTPINFKKMPVSVILKNDKGSWFFPSIRQASIFLSKQAFYCPEICRKLFGQRLSFIFGYHVTYLGKKYS